MNFGFDKICRTCMVESSTLLSIFDTNSTQHDGALNGVSATSIIAQLSSFTAIRACRNDGLPDQVCLTCLSEINRAVSFKQKCERSEHTLKSYLHQASILNAQEKFVEGNINCNNCEDSSEVAIGITTNNHPTIFRSDWGKVEDNSIYYKCEECIQSFQYATELTNHINIEHRCSAQRFMVRSVDDDPKTDNDVEILEDGLDEENEEKPKISELLTSSDTNRIKYNLEDKPISKNTDAKDSELISCDSNIQTAINEIIPTKRKEYRCEMCQATFVSPKSLRMHQNMKKCTKKTFVCDFCQRVFVRKRYLTVHIMTHVAEKLNCPHCPKKYSRKDQLAAHIRSHSGAKKHACPQCPKGFSMLSTLKDHLRTHNGERPFLCSICGKGFSQSTNLKQHVMRHTNTKPFKCTECPQTFVSKGELDSHLRKHTGDHPFVCDICGSGFTTSSSLSKHRRIHTGERPYACDFCPMRFTALGTLKNHRRTHTGERPFRCSFCDRGFAQRSDCVSHQRTHTGERPYSCKECNKSFLQHSTLKTHMKTHRSLNSSPRR